MHALAGITQQLALMQQALVALQQENTEIKNRLNQIPVNPIVAQFEEESLQPVPIIFSTPEDIIKRVL